MRFLKSEECRDAVHVTYSLLYLHAGFWAFGTDVQSGGTS